MHAWICSTPTGVDDLQWQELPTPEPGANEVRLRVRAASLNFPDILIVQNKYQFKPALPFVPGTEFAGEVEAVGPGVTAFKVGDRVAAQAGTGGFGSHAIVPVDKMFPIPDSMSFEHGAAFALTYGTSHHALLDRGQLKAGETVLVLGAAGGVGTAAVQIAKAVGARVIARSQQRREVRAVPADRRRRHHQLQPGQPARPAESADQRQGPRCRL